MQNSSEWNIFADVQEMHDVLVKKILDNLPQESPTLYHYTSLANALSIIESEKIYLTNMRYLNDPSELVCGIEIAETIITEIEDSYCKADKKHIALLSAALKSRILISFTPLTERDAKIEKYLQGFTPKYSKEQIAWLRSYFKEEWYFYIACFSERNDDLRQWVPYADHAKGVALGFKGVANNQHFFNSEDDLYIIRVCYKDDETKKNYLRDFLNQAFAYLEKHESKFRVAGSDNDPNHPLNVFMSSLTELLIGDLVACKSEHYKDEEEWRLYYHTTERRIKNGARHPNFFVKSNIIKPYLDFTINLESLIDIRLAPNCPENLNKDSLTMLLRKHGVECLNISKSIIPYRG